MHNVHTTGVYIYKCNAHEQTDMQYVDGWIDIFPWAVVSWLCIFLQDFGGVKVQMLREIPLKPWIL